jgi:hypothetical protein
MKAWLFFKVSSLVYGHPEASRMLAIMIMANLSPYSTGG